MSDPLDLAVDPELVHDRAKTLTACIRHEGAQVRRLVPAAWLHAIEDELRVLTQHTF